MSSYISRPEILGHDSRVQGDAQADEATGRKDGGSARALPPLQADPPTAKLVYRSITPDHGGGDPVSLTH